MLSWFTSLFSTPTGDVSYFFSKPTSTPDQSLLETQSSSTTTTTRSNPITDQFPMLFHSSINHRREISLGSELFFSPPVSVYTQIILNENSFLDRRELSARLYLNDPSQLFLRVNGNTFRPHGSFFSIGLSLSQTDEECVSFLVGKKTYIGEKVLSCPLVITGFIGSSISLPTGKISAEMGIDAGIEF